MTLLNKIDKAVCLTLDKRYEDGVKLKESFKPFGVNVELFVAGNKKNFPNLRYNYEDTNELPPKDNYSTTYPTWHARPNAYNAWKSHHEIFAKCKKDENLLLLEDDAELSLDFLEVVERVSPFFEQNKWDAIYFGFYHFKSTSTDTEGIRRLNGDGGFHGVLISPQLRKNLLNWNACGPYDWITGNYLHQYYSCYGIHPCIINQRSGFSFVEGCNLDKPARDKL